MLLIDSLLLNIAHNNHNGCEHLLCGIIKVILEAYHEQRSHRAAVRQIKLSTLSCGDHHHHMIHNNTLTHIQES